MFCSASQAENGSTDSSFPWLFPARPFHSQRTGKQYVWLLGEEGTEDRTTSSV